MERNDDQLMQRSIQHFSDLIVFGSRTQLAERSRTRWCIQCIRRWEGPEISVSSYGSTPSIRRARTGTVLDLSELYTLQCAATAL
jgi:hypothetical protein